MRIIIHWLKEAFISLKRNFVWNAWSSILIVVCFFSFAVVLTAGLTAQYLASALEQKVDISVDLKPIDANYIDIKSELEKINGIKSVSFVSKEQTYQEMLVSLGDNDRVLRDLGDNPFYDSFVIQLVNPQEVKRVANEIQKKPYALEVEYGSAVSSTLFKITDAIQSWGIVITVAVAIITSLIVFVVIRSNISQRKLEIEIKQRVGASMFSVRTPYIIEALMLNSVSVIIVYGFFYIGYDWVVMKANSKVPFAPFLDKGDVMGAILMPLLLLGFSCAFIGSVLSTQRYLKRL